MITITIKPNSIESIGHANYAKYNKDIVCSAVSVLMQTLELRGESIKASGHMSVWTKDTQALNLIADGLKQIAEHYPNNVEVIE